MPISAHISATGLTSDLRSAGRRSLRLEVLGTHPAQPSSNVLIHNLSEIGVLVETKVEIAVGDELTLALPHAQDTAAEVVWSSGDLHGCRFRKAISTAAVSAAQLLSPVESQREPGGHGSKEALAPFSSRLRELRKSSGISVAQLADAVGVSKPTIWSWETGKTRPRPANIAALADVLRVSKADLLDGVSPADVPPPQIFHVEEATQSLSRSQFTDPVSTGDRMQQLIGASKSQIAALAGTTADKVRIIVEL